MARASRSFQIFAKPAGAACNLACGYCYYLDKERLSGEGAANRLPDVLLEEYIVQHFEASPDETVRFSWHGGEPTILGLEYFRRIVALQRRHQPAGRRIANGIQTNGTLLDDEWGRFLAGEGFSVGLSLDGPEDAHDRHRRGKGGQPSFLRAMRGYETLRRQGVAPDILCAVGADNVKEPLGIYRFFKAIGAATVSFLPLVERSAAGDEGAASPLSVPSEAWGAFLCAVFDEWVREDIGRIKIQIVEEAARIAFGQEHSLCLFRPTCGDIPVVERNGDVYACDHFADPAHRLGNILETSLAELLESPALRAFGRAKREALPRACRECEVLGMCRGECPKNRFGRTADGEAGLNYLCPGYRRFFSHVRPFVDDVAAAWKKRP
jgi:uncharacterized protein